MLTAETRSYLSATHPWLIATAVSVVIFVIVAIFAAFLWEVWSLLPLALLLLGTIFVFVQAHARYANFTQATPQIVQNLWEMADLSADDHFMLIDIGSMATVRGFARRLRYGQLHVINVYNPQIVPNPVFLRARQRMADQTPFQPDPRVTLFNARIDLLPFPDATVDTILTNQVLSEMPAAPDRATLITEIHRVLRPGGRWLSSERIAPATDVLLFGIGHHAPESADRWAAQIQPYGLQLRQQAQINPVLISISMQKPGEDAPRQLRFSF